MLKYPLARVKPHDRRRVRSGRGRRRRRRKNLGQVREVIDRTWQAIESQDLETLSDLLSADVDFAMPGLKVRGAEQVKSLVEAFYRAFPDLRHEILTRVESGDMLAMEIRVTGTHTGPLKTPAGEVAASGRTVDYEAADYFKVKDGRITAWHAYFDQVTFLSQLGLMPPPEQVE